MRYSVGRVGSRNGCAQTINNIRDIIARGERPLRVQLRFKTVSRGSRFVICFSSAEKTTTTAAAATRSCTTTELVLSRAEAVDL